jgi:hypothetical protein
VSVSRPSSIFRKSCLILLLSVPLGAAAFAQKAAAATLPKYDPQTETKFKAIVEELKLPEKPESKENVHLLVKEGEEVVDITLCPKSFLDDMGVNFSKGDAVELTVSKVKAEGADFVLARQVTKGDDMLVLRDGKGAPIWNWKR